MLHGVQWLSDRHDELEWKWQEEFVHVDMSEQGIGGGVGGGGDLAEFGVRSTLIFD
jgi:hypothetical protein